MPLDEAESRCAALEAGEAREGNPFPERLGAPAGLEDSADEIGIFLITDAGTCMLRPDRRAAAGASVVFWTAACEEAGGDAVRGAATGTATQSPAIGRSFKDVAGSELGLVAEGTEFWMSASEAGTGA